MKSNAFWKADWFTGLIISTLFLVAFLISFSPLQTLEFKAYDMGVATNITPTDDNIVIVDIDNESIERIGRWPWQRSVVGDLVGQLANAGARLIGVDIFYSEKQPLPKAIASNLKLAEILRTQGKHEEADRLLAEARAMDEDASLVSATAKAGNVFMPMFFELGEQLGRPDTAVPPYVSRYQLRNIGNMEPGAEPLSTVKMYYPFAELANAAAGLGFLNITVDNDGVLRTEPLIVDYFGEFLPSMSLAMAMRNLNLNPEDVTINLGQGIEVGALDITTDANMRMYPAFYGNSDGSSFKRYSFYEVAAGNIPARAFKNKIVLIGVTGSGLGETYVTHVSNNMSGVEYHAHVLQSVLQQSFYTHPAWTTYAELGIFLIIALYLMFALPRLGAGAAAAISLFLLLALLGSSFVLLTGSNLWLQTASAAALLIIGHLLMTSKRFFASEKTREKISSDSAETNKMLGLSFQSQGMLDMAFEKFRKCPVNTDILQCLYNLALDFERKRQFNKAMAVYEYMEEEQSGFKDVKERIARNKAAGETVIFGATSNNAMSTLLLTGGAKPTLGRYEIIKELGKGAMGTVYLGRDPKINREVAIKTMALSQEFEPDELEDVKERLFREAETAGMLNHPNIVTIYDAGEEHDLAYIAMEFLNGNDLAPYTKKGKLLPPAAVLKICGKVAEALHYAHSHNVVHRDIKPANIMLLKDKTVKVTDFGIARITASSKTKTGVVLGTPSYMSPEQLSGKHVDGRSDLFSLGVMLYEMLSGTRPFRGDSMATLMFQIANEPHPDIREYREELPEDVAKLVDRMLAKDPEARLKNGNEVVRAIVACLRSMAAASGGKA